MNRTKVKAVDPVREWEERFRDRYMEYSYENENTLLDPDLDGEEMIEFIRQVEDSAIKRTEERFTGEWGSVVEKSALARKIMEREIADARARGREEKQEEIVNSKKLSNPNPYGTTVKI